MKIFAFKNGGRRRLGVVDGNTPRDLSAAIESAGIVDNQYELLKRDFFRPQQMVPFLKRWRRYATRLEGEIHFLPPVEPGAVIAIGRNFAEHVRELGNSIEEEILFFSKLPSSVTGHGAPIIIPRHMPRVDHEAELGIVIARDGHHIPPQKAFSYIAGYTCLNDVTAREEQGADKARKRPWTRSKGYDSFCPIGPYLVSMDDIVDPNQLRIVCRVNGEVRQSGMTSGWIHKIPAMIHYISRHTTLRAGDVIATGTPSGVSPLNPGDVVEIDISGVGLLRNTVEREADEPVVEKRQHFETLQKRARDWIETARDGGEAFERIVALLDTVPHYHWCGIYRVEPDGSLGLGPFRGKATEHTKIAPGRGLCGRAITENRTIIVDDVTTDPAYLACSLETRSEIVVPVRAGGVAVAEIDLDSDVPAAFDASDRAFVEHLAELLGSFLDKTRLPRMWDER